MYNNRPERGEIAALFNARSLSLTEGPLFSSIVRFSLPLMLSNVLQVLSCFLRCYRPRMRDLS